MSKDNAQSAVVSVSNNVLNRAGIEQITNALRELLADVFALFLKTKNFHWHMSGPNFREYHLLLDEHAAQLFDITDDIAERARKLGGNTLHSIGEISRTQRLSDNDSDYVPAVEMLTELLADNEQLVQFLRSTHELCNQHGDVATASLIETWIDQGERRRWFLAETVRGKC